jgi:hypothetical protein
MDLLEIALSVVAVLFAWRFLLSLAASIAIAYPLGHFFGPVAGFAVAVSGICFGGLWQGRWLSGLPLFASVPSPPISRPVVFLGLAFIGALWGGFSVEILGSALAGGAILVSGVALVGAWRTLVLKRRERFDNLAFSAFSLLCGLGGLYAISSFHA